MKKPTKEMKLLAEQIKCQFRSLSASFKKLKELPEEDTEWVVKNCERELVELENASGDLQ